MFKKLIPLMTITLMMTGCANMSTVSVDTSKLRSLKPKSITVTERAKPDFAAMTAGKATFALVGAFAAISEGNSIVEENSVEDPANTIKDKLAKKLSAKYKLELIDNENVKVDSTDIDDIIAAYPNVDLILDIETFNWQFAYFPTDWDNYRVIYSANIRLIDTQNEELIASGTCSITPNQTKSSPSYEQLLAKQAKRLKEELNKAGKKCTSQFQKKILKLRGR